MKKGLQPTMIESPKLVGTPRFELGTSRTPSVRATRLRHVPSASLSIPAKDQLSNQAAVNERTFALLSLASLAVGFLLEKAQQRAQFSGYAF